SCLPCSASAAFSARRRRTSATSSAWLRLSAGLLARGAGDAAAAEEDRSLESDWSAIGREEIGEARELSELHFCPAATSTAGSDEGVTFARPSKTSSETTAPEATVAATGSLSQLKRVLLSRRVLDSIA